MIATKKGNMSKIKEEYAGSDTMFLITETKSDTSR